MSTLERTQARTPDTGRAPSLSVVVTARNDNHGGDLLYRMQVFVNGLAAQCDRFALDAELILVEWNPPDDRPRLREALEWPRSERLSIRIVTVPSELHRRLDYSDRLPLFQMIAKNVGIRRARGRFVLATNVDVLFSDGLMRFVSRQLSGRRFYRADRHDVECQLDPDAPVEEQLAECARSVIRICERDGIRDLRTGEYFRIYYAHASHPWWVALALRAPSYLRVRLARRARRLACLLTLPARPRRLANRVLRRIEHWLVRDLRTLERIVEAFERAAFAVKDGRVRSAVAARLAPLRRRAAAAREGAPSSPLALALGALRGPFVLARRAIAATAVAQKIAATREMVEWERARVHLHTNASGDFTLMSREAWFRLRGYPELQIFSMHIDGLLVYMAHWAGLAEVIAPHPVYHLEHSHGFKPDTQGLRQLNARLEQRAIPQISNVQFHRWALQMYRERRPLAFNGDDWGYPAVDLEEDVVTLGTALAGAEERG